MLAQSLLIAGVFILIFAGYAGVKLIKSRRHWQRRQAGSISLSCAGDCGSAFEFILKLEDGRITHAETKGGRCAHSLICARAAATLAQGLTLGEISRITPGQIARKAGGLSPEHMHCAILAAHGLVRAVKALERENNRVSA